MMPLMVPFLAAAKVNASIRAMQLEGNAEMLLGLSPMEDYPRYLRFCAECCARDVETFGTAHWHRAHQAPGVVVCHLHGMPLQQTDVSARSAQFVPLATPEDICAYKPFAVPRESSADALWLATQMECLLPQSAAALDQAQLTSLYRTKLTARGYIDTFGRLRLRRLISDFTLRFRLLFSALGIEPPDPAARDNWALRLLRRPRSEQSPLRHLLMMRFLEMDAQASIKAAALLPAYKGRDLTAPVATYRSRRITETKVLRKRADWEALMATSTGGPLRAKNDALYSWLWRYDRQWLHASTAPR
jgi:hypothetical protein